MISVEDLLGTLTQMEVAGGQTAREAISAAQQVAGELGFRLDNPGLRYHTIDFRSARGPGLAGATFTTSGPAEKAGDLGYLLLATLRQMDAGEVGEVQRSDALLAQMHDQLAWAMLQLERGNRGPAREELLGALRTWGRLCELHGWQPQELLAAAGGRVDAAGGLARPVAAAAPPSLPSAPGHRLVQA